MSLCPNCQKEIKKDASFCIYCQLPTRGKPGKEKGESFIPRLIAIITFLYPFIVLVGYQFFERRLEYSAGLGGSLVILFISAIIAFLTVIQKPRFFRFLSLLFNLSVIGWYAIWVNSLGYIYNF
jgi:hypothetical protein